jgi:rRNA maturation RNase YbeY
MKKIFYFKEGVSFRMKDGEKIETWLLKMIKSEGYKVENINFIFCNDEHLKKINKKYLNHNYFTDVITFDNSMEKKNIIGDIFISIDRVKENAEKYDTGFYKELSRVMVHGVLHLTGYDDKDERSRKKMKKMEDDWLMKSWR